MSRRVQGLFGYHAVQVGHLGDGCDPLRASLIPHRAVLDPEAAEAAVHAQPEALPLAGDSVDLVLLVHTLEFCDQPHEALREAERVLVPEGHLLIVGFNPISLFGLWKLGLGWRGQVPWAGRFYLPFRVRDWLSLLGFDVLDSERLAFLPPWQRRGGFGGGQCWERLSRRCWPYLGGIYVLVARKRVARLTPLKPRWRPRRAVLGGQLTRPSTRGSS